MKVFGADVETFRIAQGVAAPTLVCYSWDDGEGDSGVVLDDEGFELFYQRLADPEIIQVFHHAPYDIVVKLAEASDRHRGDLSFIQAVFLAFKEGRIRCTKIREQILENAKGELKFDWDEDLEEYKRASFTLERCIWNRCKIFVKKTADTWRLRYGHLFKVPIAKWPPEAIEYALKDSTLAHKLFFAQEDSIAEDDLEHPEDLCPRRPDGTYDIPGEIATAIAAFVLELMRVWGVRTDPEMTKVVRAEFQEKFDAAVAVAKKWDLVGDKKVKEVGPLFWDIYGASPTKEEMKKIPADALQMVVRPKRKMKPIQDRIRYVYQKHDEKVPMTSPSKKFPAGQISTDRETLTFKKFPTWEKDEGLMAVADVVRYGKLLTTYVPVLERGAKFPITPGWNALVETFRTSCSKPNLQNLPRGSAKYGDDLVRRCFIPRPGWVFVSADYATLEMRTLGQRMIDLGFSHALAEAFKAGKDPHLIMTAEMFEQTYEVIEARYKALEKFIEDARQQNKISNYGLGGGMSGPTLRDYARNADIDIELSLSHKLHANYRKIWGTDEYFSYVDALMDGGTCKTFVDPRTGYVRGQIRYTALANWGFQHPAAVGAKAALVAVSEECYAVPESPLFGSRPVIFPHDEIILEVPRDFIGAERASQAARRLVEIMIREMKVVCPDVPIEVDACMMRRWIKGAKGVRVDGILVPSKRVGKDWVPDLEEKRAAA